MLPRALLVFTLCAAAAGAIAGPDVPTWQLGDSWDVQNTYRMIFSDPGSGMAVDLPTLETFVLSVTGIGEMDTGLAGVNKVYDRTRAGGTVSSPSNGTVMISTYGPFDIRWQSGTGTVKGESWNCVSDWASARETFATTGSLEVKPLFSFVTVAELAYQVTIESYPTEELADFPLDAVGETWWNDSIVRAYGYASIKFDPSFPWFLVGGQPADVNESFDQVLRSARTLQYVGDEAKGVHISADGDELWYKASRKEFQEMQLNSYTLGDLGGLTSFTRTVTGQTLADPPTYPSNLAFNPAKPVQGTTATLTGKAGAGAPVSATILYTGESASTTANGSGDFSLSLFAPRHDDFSSPSSGDAGSFGVEVVASGSSRKVVTLPLAAAPALPLYTQTPFRETFNSATPFLFALDTIAPIPNTDMPGWYYESGVTPTTTRLVSGKDRSVKKNDTGTTDGADIYLRCPVAPSLNLANLASVALSAEVNLLNGSIGTKDGRNVELRARLAANPAQAYAVRLSAQRDGRGALQIQVDGSPWIDAPLTIDETGGDNTTYTLKAAFESFVTATWIDCRLDTTTGTVTSYARLIPSHIAGALDQVQVLLDNRVKAGIDDIVIETGTHQTPPAAEAASWRLY